MKKDVGTAVAVTEEKKLKKNIFKLKWEKFMRISLE